MKIIEYSTCTACGKLVDAVAYFERHDNTRHSLAFSLCLSCVKSAQQSVQRTIRKQAQLARSRVCKNEKVLPAVSR